MLKFLHTADWHLGSPQHPKIYKENLLASFSAFLSDKNINLVMCVGDVFDQHNPDQKIKDDLLRFLVEQASCTFLFVVGNHDFSDKTKTYHSLQYLRILQEKLDNVVVYDTNGIYDLHDGYSVGKAAKRGIYKFLVVVDDDWETLKNYPLDQKIDITAWHGTVPGISFKKTVEFNSDGQIDTFIKRSGCKYLALGDIHKHLQLHDRCWYPGALVQKTYGCESGMVGVTIDGKKITTESFKLDLPEKKNFNLSFEIGKDSEESIITFVRENIKDNSLVRLIFNLPLEEWSTINREQIKKELCDFEEVKLNNIPPTELMKRINSEGIKKAPSIEDEVKIIIDQEQMDVNKDELLTVCKEFL